MPRKARIVCLLVYELSSARYGLVLIRRHAKSPLLYISLHPYPHLGSRSWGSRSAGASTLCFARIRTPQATLCFACIRTPQGTAMSPLTRNQGEGPVRMIPKSRSITIGRRVSVSGEDTTHNPHDQSYRVECNRWLPLFGRFFRHREAERVMRQLNETGYAYPTPTPPPYRHDRREA
jgi:hypothetical protein